MSKVLTPRHWRLSPLDKVAAVQTGIAKGKTVNGCGVTLPYLRVANVQDGHVDLSVVKEITVEPADVARYGLRDGDVLFTEGGDFDKLGRGTVWHNEISPCLHQNHIFAVRPAAATLLPEFLAFQAASRYGRRYFQNSSKQSTNLASINSTQLKNFPVLVAPIEEQRKIAAILRTWNEAIDKLDTIITKAERLHRALTHSLVFGRCRLTQFRSSNTTKTFRWFSLPGGWKCGSIGSVAKEISERHGDDEAIEVLSCSKYDGFVRSLEYFKKQVFSTSLAGYKKIWRGDFGFPSNHIEEGSIGLQDVVDVGLVSPIYTVFRFPPDQVDNRYAYSVLKTPLYRHIFEVSTSASVDRRGSLRWIEFSSIPFPVPPLDEQRAIVEVISHHAKKLAKLSEQKKLLEKQKRGLMQKLLTGEWRVKL